MTDLTANTISLSNPGTSFQYAITVTQPSGGPEGVMSVTDDTANLRMVVGLGEMLLAGEGGPARIQIVDPTQGTTFPVLQVDDAIHFSDGDHDFDSMIHRVSTGVLRASGQFRAADGLRGIYLSGAGKTKAADGDFVVAPTDGMMAVVRNTTNGNVYLSARANGAWKSVQLS